MTDHERIWLEPKGAPDRCWCQDNQWGDEGVEYVRAAPRSQDRSAWSQEDAERENKAFAEWFKDRGYPNYPGHYPLITENAMHAAWQEAAKRSARSTIPTADSRVTEKPVICVGRYTISQLLAREAVEIDAAILIPASDLSEPNVEGSPLLEWAVCKWNSEVKHRPLVNVHRRSLDDVWRQVIRWAGGDPIALVGPSHDELLATEGQRS